jgi:hypothetical protein
MHAEFERLLVPGCTDLPACRCGKEMQIVRTSSFPEGTEAHIRVYDCPVCHHELRLTVWGAEPEDLRT